VTKKKKRSKSPKSRRLRIKREEKRALEKRLAQIESK
jgi:hypothetical protein